MFSQINHQDINKSSLKDSGMLPLFTILCLGVWLHAASSMLAATTLPQAVAEIGGANLIGWAFSLYQLGSILAGAATGMYVLYIGLRYALLGSALLYAIGCVVCAVAPEISIMLLGRLLQGVGGGSILALTYVSLNRLFPHEMIPRLIALISVVWSVSAFCGPLIGGSLSTYGLWRFAYWAFAGQAMIFVLAVFFLVVDPIVKNEKSPLKIPLVRLSLIGSTILLVSMAGAKFHLLISPLLCFGGFLLFRIFLWMDNTNTTHRLFPKNPFDIKTSTGCGLLFFFTISMSTMSFLVYGPFLLDILYGVTPLSAGYIVVSGAMAWGVSAIVFSRFNQHSEKWLIRLGSVLVTCSNLGFALVFPMGQLWLVLSCAICQGIGLGMLWGFVARRILAATAASERDLTSSTIPTTQQIGFAVGAATTGIVANAVGFGENISIATAQSAGFWLFMAYLPFLFFANILAWKFSASNELPRRKH
jgi:MFS family permease